MKRKVLVIDDDKLVAKSIEKLLGTKGYEVYLAPNGNEALELTKHSNFDLIISDIRMPGMDGIETIKKIKEHQDKVNNFKSEFMAITGYAADDAPTEGAKLGITNFILKPFESKKFLEAVDNCFEDKGQNRSLLFSGENEEKRTPLNLKHNYFSIDKRVYLEHTNIMGNTYFANYVLWQGEAREALLLSHPCFSEEMERHQHIRMITHSVYHRFVQETTFGDLLEIRLTSREIKHCSFVLVFQFYSKLTGAFIGEGWQRITFVDMSHGGVCTIPVFIKDLILPIQESLNIQ